MSPEEVTLEVERVMNLVRGFGWTMKEQKIEADKVVLVIEKPMVIEAPAGPT